ncbi:MAG: hypothetical protein ACI351_00750 [Candidatus Avelusimicrobium sp.]|uniref:hypothetical protein n=1 Tax=Candidatus Avelusimicrobium sp. TaxID=3048833 RepID=UPI003F0E9656
MHKLTFILLACVLCPSLAGAWGLLPQCVTRGPNGENKPSCLGESFVTAGAVPCLEVKVIDEQKRSGYEGAELRRNLRESVQTAFNSWINTVRGTIASSEDHAKFDDFLKSFPIALEVRVPGAAREQTTERRRKKESVPSPVSTDKTCMNLTLRIGGDGGKSCAQAFVVDSEIKWYKHYIADPSSGSRTPLENACPAESVLAHEIGHLLGLADLYENKLEGLAKDMVITQDFSLLRTGIEISTMERFSMMGKRSIGCDDVDGIINMADFMAVKRGEVSDRVKNGWKSFCPAYSSVHYAYGQPYRTTVELEENKERIDAVLFFEQSYSKWNAEYNRLNAEIQTLNARVDTAPLPLKTANLMDSAKVNYLEDLRSKVRALANKLERQDPTKPILEEYKQLLKDNEEEKLNSFANQAVLDNYTPYQVHLEASEAKPRHRCIKCDDPIPPEEEVVRTVEEYILYQHSKCRKKPLYKSKVEAYANKYGYDREKIPAPTYSQLRAQAIAEGIHLESTSQNLDLPLPTREQSGSASRQGASSVVSRTSEKHKNATGTKPAGNSSKTSGFKPVTPSEADQFSEAALVGRPRAKVQSLPSSPTATSASTATASAKPAALVCSVCGQKIANEADAYIPLKRGYGPVHKHSECAFKYFSRFYSVDNTSLEQYNKSYWFGNEPRDVTAAKGLMKKLGLTPEEVKMYTVNSRRQAQQ